MTDELHDELATALAAALSDDGLYETEYDGQMFILCRFCSYQEPNRATHEPECTVTRGSKALASYAKTREKANG